MRSVYFFSFTLVSFGCSNYKIKVTATLLKRLRNPLGLKPPAGLAQAVDKSSFHRFYQCEHVTELEYRCLSLSCGITTEETLFLLVACQPSRTTLIFTVISRLRNTVVQNNVELQFRLSPRLISRFRAFVQQEAFVMKYIFYKVTKYIYILLFEIQTFLKQIHFIVSHY